MPANADVQDRLRLQLDSNPHAAWRQLFPPTDPPVYVYAIRAGDDGPVKIGIAVKPWERIATLQAGNPFRLRGIAAWRGSQSEERALHEMFAADRLEGEWFKPSEDLLALVDALGGSGCEFAKPGACLSQRSLDLDQELMGMGTCEACGMEFPA